MPQFLRGAQGWPYLLTPFIPIALALDIAGAAAGSRVHLRGAGNHPDGGAG